MQPIRINKSKQLNISWFYARMKSIRYAFEGIKELLKEPNAKIHLVATIAVVAAGLIQQLDAYRWTTLVFAIGMVWVAEGVNTAIEKMCNLIVDGKWHPTIKIIKDVSAGAVLIASMMSVVIGVLVFFF